MVHYCMTVKRFIYDQIILCPDLMKDSEKALKAVAFLELFRGWQEYDFYRRLGKCCYTLPSPKNWEVDLEEPRSNPNKPFRFFDNLGIHPNADGICTQLYRLGIVVRSLNVPFEWPTMENDLVYGGEFVKNDSAIFQREELYLRDKEKKEKGGRKRSLLSRIDFASIITKGKVRKQ